MMLKPILVPALALALAVQLFHAVLCIIWNLIGVWQLSKGLLAIGPTASVAAIGIILVLSGLLIVSVRSKHVALYLGVSGLMFLAAVSAIYGGFNKDPSFWPSEAWRYAGIIVNAIGLVGFSLALGCAKQLKN